ncbi:hypothetical protein CEXT_129511 [Caerostris extrusa]|uniref:Uncharacterized protein n=1 Tax=Caerostris extrusa TaxID=172846 RepID=A0AAV4X6P5_CAEEX|nr:hypothetical protein CEXT_129511 [Caerostris extrusa]
MERISGIQMCCLFSRLGQGSFQVSYQVPLIPKPSILVHYEYHCQPCPNPLHQNDILKLGEAIWKTVIVLERQLVNSSDLLLFSIVLDYIVRSHFQTNCPRRTSIRN